MNMFGIGDIFSSKGERFRSLRHVNFSPNRTNRDRQLKARGSNSVNPEDFCVQIFEALDKYITLSVQT